MSTIFQYPATSSSVAGGATAANQALEIAALNSIDTKTPTVGQKTMANSSPVVIASDQSAVPVSGPLTDAQLRATAVPVSGTVTANAGSGTFAVSGPLTDTQLRATAVPVSGTVTANNASVSATGAAVPASATMVAGSDGTNLRAVKVSSTGVVSVDGSAVTQPVSGTVTANAGSGTFAVSGPLTDTQLRATAVPVSGTVTANAGSGTFAVSGPLTDTQLRATAVPISGTVTANAGTGTFITSEERVSTSTITSVAASASSVSLLASTAGRKNATFYNDSTAILYLKLGTTASTSSYTVQMPAGAYYELPLGRIYTGAIDGIWASATGNVRITELS